jgi:type IV/VI secretion system ImpK/VasF family protein
MAESRAPTLEEVCSRTFLFLTTFLRSVDRAEFDLDWVRERVLALFEEQKQLASRDGDLFKLYQKAQYLLAVVVDGLILNSEWPQRYGWNLLEAELYGTHIGGEEFFERMKDAAYKDSQMLEIFYLSLAVGFQGKYVGNPEELAEIRQDLFLRLGNVPRDLTERITPQAYEENIETDHTSMPVVNILQFGAVLLGIIVIIVIGSTVLYDVKVGEITQEAGAAAQGREVGDEVPTAGEDG